MTLPERYNIFKRRTTLTRQLRVLLIGVILPFIVMIAVVLGMLGSFNREYAITLQNASTAGEFNNNFKDALDLDMYYYVVGSKNIDHLPLEVVENAQQVITRLQATTTQKENQWRIKSMLRLCQRLKECMLDIESTESYDENMEKLENNIYILTDLVQTYMYEYIYDEVRELSSLQNSISQRVSVTIVTSGLISLTLVIFMLGYSTGITRSIARPIKKLCEKVERLGRGDFTVVPIETYNVEIKTLDDGFNDMVGRINALLERVKNDQNSLRRAELELLQAQINPHFLYNTFDSIVWLAEAHKDDEVIQMTTNLSTFFRNSLNNGSDTITLALEKQQVESYLSIQQIRYRDILKYDIQIPNELLAYKLPKLTLQPLVENAIYHGIKNKRGFGVIVITGEEDEKDIILKIQDDGIGMTEEQLNALRAGVYEDKHTGLGLVNVHKRLKLYCGEDYGLTFDSVYGIGSTVSVRIPKQNKLLN